MALFYSDELLLHTPWKVFFKTFLLLTKIESEVKIMMKCTFFLTAMLCYIFLYYIFKNEMNIYRKTTTGIIYDLHFKKTVFGWLLRKNDDEI